MIQVSKAAEKDMDEFKLCMIKCRKATCVGTLKQYIEKKEGNGFHTQVLRQEGFDGEFSLRYDRRGRHGYVYLDCVLKHKSDMQRLANMWDTVTTRADKMSMETKPNDYRMIIDLVNDDLTYGKCYLLSLIQPVFISNEGEGNVSNVYQYKMVFEQDDVYFGIEDITADEVAYAIESNTNAIYTDNDDEDDTNSSGDSFDENSKFINNTDFM